MKENRDFTYLLGSQTQTSMGTVVSTTAHLSYSDLISPWSQQKNQELENNSLKQELELLKSKVSKLEESRIRSELIDDIEAQKEVETYLLSIKEKGQTKIDFLTIAAETDLPLDQLDRIMSKLKTKGIRDAV